MLLLDEPLSNLDPTLRQTMRDELRATLRRSGVTALFVTHDQEDAFAVADRIAMLSRGKLLQVGTPEELVPLSGDAHGRGVRRRAPRCCPAERMGEGVWVTVGSVALAAPARDRRPGQTRRASWSPCCARSRSRWWTTTSSPRGKGTVVGRRFAGGHTVYQVRLESGAIAEVMGDGFGAPEGETVRVRLSGQPLAVVTRHDAHRSGSGAQRAVGRRRSSRRRCSRCCCGASSTRTPRSSSAASSTDSATGATSRPVRADRDALWGTVVVSIGSVIGALLIGVPLAFLLSRTEFRGRRLLSGVATLPAALPPLVGVLAFLFLYGESGVVTRARAARARPEARRRGG